MYSEIKQKIVSSDESFLFKGKPSSGKTSMLFDCFLQKVYDGSCENVFFLNPSLPQTYFLKDKAVCDSRFCSGYNQLNILTFHDFIKLFIRENLLYSENKPFSLPVEQYGASRIFFLLDILGRIILPEPYETWKKKEKFANNLGDVFTFFSELSIRPDFFKKIKGYEWILDVYNLYKKKSLENGFYFYDILPGLAENILLSLPDERVIGEHFIYIDDLQEIIPSQYEFLKMYLSFLDKKNVFYRIFASYETE